MKVTDIVKITITLTVFYKKITNCFQVFTSAALIYDGADVNGRKKFCCFSGKRQKHFFLPFTPAPSH